MKFLSIFSLSLLVSFTSGNAQAANSCFEKTPFVDEENNPIAFIEESKLSVSESKTLERLFARAKGRWSGQTEGYLCSGTEKAPKTKPDDFYIDAEVNVDSSNNMRFDASFVALDRNSTRQELLRIYISDNVLRLGQNSKGGNAKITSLTDDSVEFVYVHRVVFGHRASQLRHLIKKLQVSSSSLSMHHQVYLNGLLLSESRWSMHR